MISDLSVPRFKLISAFFSVLVLFGCSSDPENYQTTKRQGTFADIAKNSSNAHKITTELLTRKARDKKLAKIYYSMMTIEPSEDVRAQIQHRIIQLDVNKYEKNDSFENKDVLEGLAKQYKNLLLLYPDRTENESIQYALSKTLDLQGKQKESLLTIESLLSEYPNTEYYAELQFRRAELYYNLQHYPFALKAYQSVLEAENNEAYYLNSLYMSGWSLFKLNRLNEADEKFIKVLSFISQSSLANSQVGKVNGNSFTDAFTFEQVSPSHKSLAADTQRVLSISLSQQAQAKSLVSLLKKERELANVKQFEHILFANLANFLLEQKLDHDAMLTYQTYLNYSPNTLWASRFTLALIDLYRSKNHLPKIKNLKLDYVNNFGLPSSFWQSATKADRNEVTPKLMQFSLANARRLYVKAQDIFEDKLRELAFKDAVKSLDTFLSAAQYANDKLDSKVSLIQEQFLLADASFEAKLYNKALRTYEQLAYKTSLEDIRGFTSLQTNSNNDEDSYSLEEIQLASAYACSTTIRNQLKEFGYKQEQENKSNLEQSANKVRYEWLMTQRQTFDDLFMLHFSNDRRAKFIAVQQAEYAYQQKNYLDLERYANFIFSSYNIDQDFFLNHPVVSIKDVVKFGKKVQQSLTARALKQVQITTQLNANASYEQGLYIQAEKELLLALLYINNKTKQEQIGELVASSVFAQAKGQLAVNTDTAVNHFLRLGVLVPNSKYRANAEFDAANLLLDNTKWTEAIKVLNSFKIRFPSHKYVASIPAKLAMSYEKLSLWPEAAEQLLLMVKMESNKDLKREAQYTAAEYYLKSGDTQKALVHFRTYAHNYAEPIDVAQEVRFKLSEFYRVLKKPNKRYFWYRKLIKHHKVLLQKTTATSAEGKSRSHYLASYAAFNLAQAHQQTFRWTKLKAPLNITLKRKQSAMKQAINYYQLVFDWQLAEFVPQANFSIAKMYRQLAADVMSSERPNDLEELALEEYEILLEEIAYPFEEKSIEIHQSNTQRAWNNIYDEWVQKSFSALAEIEPAKYDREEKVPEVINAIF